MVLGKKCSAAEDAIISQLRPLRKDFDNKVAKLDQSGKIFTKIDLFKQFFSGISGELRKRLCPREEAS